MTTATMDMISAAKAEIGYAAADAGNVKRYLSNVGSDVQCMEDHLGRLRGLIADLEGEAAQAASAAVVLPETGVIVGGKLAEASKYYAKVDGLIAALVEAMDGDKEVPAWRLVQLVRDVIAPSALYRSTSKIQSIQAIREETALGLAQAKWMYEGVVAVCGVPMDDTLLRLPADDNEPTADKIVAAAKAKRDDWYAKDGKVTDSDEPFTVDVAYEAIRAIRRTSTAQN